LSKLGEDEEEPESSEDEAATDQPEVQGHWNDGQSSHLLDSLENVEVFELHSI
jgi:hypothetical protein